MHDDRGIKNSLGFTLIELIIVISLISIMLFFAVPKFQTGLFVNNMDKTLRWIILKTQSIREDAVFEQKLCVLHINLDSGFLWITDELMKIEAQKKAKEKGFRLFDDVKIDDVEYPNNLKISTGTADIYFYKKGYSDNALIHLEDSENQRFTLHIRPFLTNNKLYENYFKFDELP